jgi:nucleoside 2-deoxyribosyltransferase
MNDATICPITGLPATVQRQAGDWLRFSSPGAGGLFEITGSALEDIKGHLIRPADRDRLVAWLVGQRLSGTDVPKITTDRLSPKDLPPTPPVSTRVERLYRYLQKTLTGINSSLPYQGNVTALPDDPWESPSTRAYLRAWTSSKDDDELAALVKYAAASGRISADRRISLTVDGWQYLESLDASGAAYDQGFVAMWFDPEVASAFEGGIKPAILERGYSVMRIDRKEHANKIDDEIIAEIRRSRFVVADFTCGVAQAAAGSPVAVARGGVYFEAGFALGLGIPVIWTVRNDQIGLVHFDTRQYNHIAWDDADDLREKLGNRIGAILGRGPR